MPIATTDPSTGRLIKTFDAYSQREVDRRVNDAWIAFESYRLTTFAQRSAMADAVADVLDRERDAIAETVTSEMGKTIGAPCAEVAKCTQAFRFYARRAEAFLANEPADAGAVGAIRALVRYQPLGPVLGVMPWNFPLFQVSRFAAPALMAGNVVLLKHASNVPRTERLIEDLFQRAEPPDAVFQTLLIGSDAVEGVGRDARIRAASFMGSAAAGAAVASTAGSETKKTVFELGGSDPFVVLPSADLEEAVHTGVIARCQKNEQSCIAAKRPAASLTAAMAALYARVTGASTGQDSMVGAERLRSWLEESPHRWLVIFDNADDAGVLDGLVPGRGRDRCSSPRGAASGHGLVPRCGASVSSHPTKPSLS